MQPGTTVLAGGGMARTATSGPTATLTIAGTVPGGVRPGIGVSNTDSYYGYLEPCDPYAGTGVCG